MQPAMLMIKSSPADTVGESSQSASPAYLKFKKVIGKKKATE